MCVYFCFDVGYAKVTQFSSVSVKEFVECGIYVPLENVF